jgi:hypothetical protein
VTSFPRTQAGVEQKWFNDKNTIQSKSQDELVQFQTMHFQNASSNDTVTGLAV